MSERPKLPWFQFAGTRILGATFWMAACFSAWYLLFRTPLDSDAVGFVAIAVMVLSPFVAAGTLFGRPLLGALVGIGLVAFFVVAVVIGIAVEWIPLHS